VHGDDRSFTIPYRFLIAIWRVAMSPSPEPSNLPCIW
jgi:hypothetical protein